MCSDASFLSLHCRKSIVHNISKYMGHSRKIEMDFAEVLLGIITTAMAQQSMNLQTYDEIETKNAVMQDKIAAMEVIIADREYEVRMLKLIIQGATAELDVEKFRACHTQEDVDYYNKVIREVMPKDYEGDDDEDDDTDDEDDDYDEDEDDCPPCDERTHLMHRNVYEKLWAYYKISPQAIHNWLHNECEGSEGYADDVTLYLDLEWRGKGECVWDRSEIDQASFHVGMEVFQNYYGSVRGGDARMEIIDREYEFKAKKWEAWYAKMGVETD